MAIEAAIRKIKVILADKRRARKEAEELEAARLKADLEIKAPSGLDLILDNHSPPPQG